MKKIATLFILMFITSFSTIYGQNFFDFKSNDMYIEGGLRYGINIPFVPRHAYIKDFPQYGLDLRLGKQTDGTKEWEEWFNYPAYGFLFRYEHNTLDSAKHEYRNATNDIITEWVPIGDCFTLAGFINGHIYKGRKWSFDYDIMGGLSFWPKFGNEFIGSFMNVHLSIDAGPTVQISKNLDVLGRFIFSHSSNGALVLPNHGVNVYSYQLGCRYHLNDRAEYINRDSILWHKKTALYISDAPGMLQTDTELNGQMSGEGKYYFCNTFQVGITRQFHPKFRYDVGFDIMYTDESKIKYLKAAEKYEAGELNTSLQTYKPLNSLHIAASAMFEILYNRFAFCIGGGYYLYHGIYNGTTEKKTWDFSDELSNFEEQYLPTSYQNYYERLGFKYYFGNNSRHYVGAFMKVHKDSIDYIEWTYGIQLVQWTGKNTHYKR